MALPNDFIDRRKQGSLILSMPLHHCSRVMESIRSCLSHGSTLLFRLLGSGSPVQWHSHVRISFALAAGVMLLISLDAVHQTSAADSPPSEGRRIYKEQCIACHGPLGRGDGYVLFTPPVADLTSDHVQRKSDAEMFKSLHQGLPDTAMGSWRLALSDEEIWAVIQYVRQLGKSKGTSP